MNVEITVKGRTSHYDINVDSEGFWKVMSEAEKFFDFSFHSNENTSNTLESCSPARYVYQIPKHIYDAILGRLPEYSDIAGLEVKRNEDGSQDISVYDMAGAMLAMAKAYDNSFEFKEIENSFVSLNDILNAPRLGHFFYD